MTDTKQLTKHEALDELRSYGDHAILRRANAERIAAAFGIELARQTMVDSRSKFKGAHIPWASREGQRVEAYDSQVLAYRIAVHLGVEDQARSFQGYGSQNREYWRVIGEAIA